MRAPDRASNWRGRRSEALRCPLINGAADWIPTSINLLTRQAPLYVGHSSASYKQQCLEVAGRIALPMICSAGRRLAVLATPPHPINKWSEQRELNSPHRVGSPRHGRYTILASQKPGRGDRIRTCLNSFWRRAPFLSGHHPCMAEPTGVEPVPADRQSAILPIDHSSGSLSWIRTTISAFRAQRLSIGRRGNFLNCQRSR